jgi:glutamine cyclotransferase
MPFIFIVILIFGGPVLLGCAFAALNGNVCESSAFAKLLPSRFGSDARGLVTQRRKGLARQSRNQKNFTEANEGNEEQEKFCQKCAILGNSTAKAQRTFPVFALKGFLSVDSGKSAVQFLWLRLAVLRPAARVWTVVLVAACCQGFPVFAAAGPSTNTAAAAAPTAAAANPAPAQVTNYTYQVVNTFPHDPRAFTQGLLFHDGKLLESTGLYGQSSLREVDLATGAVLRQWLVPGQFFAEGLALLDGKLYQLTWKEQKVFVYDLNTDPKTFRKVGEFSYTNEGWGLATDGHWLIMSDGSSTLRFLNPATFAVDHKIQVLKDGAPQERLNELEYVKGEIYANIWMTDWVARIDPATGRVIGMIDFSFLLPAADRKTTTDVLNGIAYDPAADRLFVTGKNWPKLFEVRLKKK